MSELTSTTQICLLLLLLIISVLIIHFLIRKRINYLPESIAVIFIGGLFGLLIKIYNQWMSPTTIVHAPTPLINSNLFFILFLPPIIFEQGYHLHKGNFFRNLGTILTFAIFGTTINAVVTGAGLYVLGLYNLSYELPWRECFIIGALNSAIDPVAILSIFQVLNVDQLLYMLVFGESILNDAVAIVLTNVLVESKRNFDSIDTNKLTAVSMIGLLASSNLTTVSNSVINTSTNNLVHYNPHQMAYEHGKNTPDIFKNKYTSYDNDDDDDNEPIYIDFKNHRNIPAKREGNHSMSYNEAYISFESKRSLTVDNSSSTTTSISTQIVSSLKTLTQISLRFILMFYASGFLGLLFGLTSALLTKYLAFDRSSLALEISLLLLTAYASYMFAEMFQLSGIMSILVCGLTMSHYTHENLSNVGRQSITVLFRTIAFLAETCVFIYLGVGIFEYQHSFHPKLIAWTISLTLIGRAAHIFPLSYILNCFRSEEHQITMPMQLIMWFAGLRGAISYALSVHVGESYGEGDGGLKRAIVTTTLITVLFTIVVLGGLTIPVVKYLRKKSSSIARPDSSESTDDAQLHAMMSKTIQFDDLLNNEENAMNEKRRGINDDEDNYAIHFASPNKMRGLERLNEFYIKPLLIRNPLSKLNQKPLFPSHENKLPAVNSDDEDSENDLLIVNQLRNEA
ncbi:unnamed protein product [Adineta steineri]|uniref:Sodium/hydrogen exchanger 8 n=1 Tax=Adineta steineri TaxID=433720 RepID=A0A819J0G3_9BILA|nr:unnamed protein product [Adineta steineri]CAF3813966.1 unnamed protein product [Adineta steineri]CAF3925456.1 unnamed protein product [Adineta steineri]